MEGENSLCLLYQEKEKLALSPTILLRDGDVYRIPREKWNFRGFTDPLQTTDLSPDGNYYSITLFSVPECPDRYVYIWSIQADPPQVELRYPDGEAFFSANIPAYSLDSTDYSILTAVAPLRLTDTGSCRILVQNGEVSFPIDFDPEADYFMK